MARLAIIEGGVVSNVVISSTTDVPGSVDVSAFPQVGPGWLYDGGGFSPPSAPDPAPEAAAVWSAREFVGLLTPEEKADIMGASGADPIIQTFLFTLQVAGIVHADDQDTIAGLAYMEAQGHIAPGRAAEILAS